MRMSKLEKYLAETYGLSAESSRSCMLKGRAKLGFCRWRPSTNKLKSVCDELAQEEIRKRKGEDKSNVIKKETLDESGNVLVLSPSMTEEDDSCISTWEFEDAEKKRGDDQASEKPPSRLLFDHNEAQKSIREEDDKTGGDASEEKRSETHENPSSGSEFVVDLDITVSSQEVSEKETSKDLPFLRENDERSFSSCPSLHKQLPSVGGLSTCNETETLTADKSEAVSSRDPNGRFSKKLSQSTNADEGSDESLASGVRMHVLQLSEPPKVIYLLNRYLMLINEVQDSEQQKNDTLVEKQVTGLGEREKRLHHKHPHDQPPEMQKREECKDREYQDPTGEESKRQQTNPRGENETQDELKNDNKELERAETKSERSLKPEVANQTQGGDHEDGHKDLKHEKTHHEEVRARCEKQAQVEQKEKDQTLKVEESKREKQKSEKKFVSVELPHGESSFLAFLNKDDREEPKCEISLKQEVVNQTQGGDHEDVHKEVKHEEAHHEEERARCEKQAQEQKEKDQTLKVEESEREKQKPEKQIVSVELPHGESSFLAFLNRTKPLRGPLDIYSLQPRSSSSHRDRSLFRTTHRDDHFHAKGRQSHFSPPLQLTEDVSMTHPKLFYCKHEQELPDETKLHRNMRGPHDNLSLQPRRSSSRQVQFLFRTTSRDHHFHSKDRQGRFPLELIEDVAMTHPKLILCKHERELPNETKLHGDLRGPLEKTSLQPRRSSSRGDQSLFRTTRRDHHFHTKDRQSRFPLELIEDVSMTHPKLNLCKHELELPDETKLHGKHCLKSTTVKKPPSPPKSHRLRGAKTIATKSTPNVEGSLIPLVIYIHRDAADEIETLGSEDMYELRRRSKKERVVV
jgi:hypothetical protein